MIIEWMFSIAGIWVVPALFSYFNPFFLPVSSYLLQRKSSRALLTAYLFGILRDIVLATPRFGMLGASSLFATLVALSISFYFSLEGFWGTLLLTSVITFCDCIFFSCLGVTFCGHAFFSLKALIFSLILSCLWVSLVKGIPLVGHFLALRRRRRDSNS